MKKKLLGRRNRRYSWLKTPKSVFQGVDNAANPNKAKRKGSK